jgi:1,4-dihydroxy-6-naphthoate synthase
VRLYSLAHSADADDAFMFEPLLKGEVRAEGARFKSVISDIETLNESAARGVYDVTAISLHGYAFAQKKYRPLSSGASVGDDYGPRLVSKKPLSGVRRRTVAIPGERTTAALLLKLFEPDCQTVTFPFDQIIDAVQTGETDAGLLIHEGQVTYREHGLRSVIDLGSWWRNETGGPVVLGLVAAKRSHPAETLRAIQRAIRGSVEHALRHPEGALQAAGRYARGMDRAKTKKFVSMYVNEFTVDLGESGRRSAEHLLGLAFERRLIPARPILDFLE